MQKFKEATGDALTKKKKRKKGHPLESDLGKKKKEKEKKDTHRPT